MTHPIHPLIVHFSIALLFTAVFFEILGFLMGQEFYRRMGLWLLVLGLVGGIVAAISGVWTEEAVKAAGVPEEAIDRHERFAILSLLVFGCLLILHWWARGRWSKRDRMIYFPTAMVGLLLLGATGFLGGELVYRYGAGVQKPAVNVPAPQATIP